MTKLRLLLAGFGNVGRRFVATRTEKGAGGTVTPSARGLSEVQLGSSAATDYDPQGDGQEYPSATQYAIDGQLPTNWETETYENSVWPNDKTGVGLYVDAGKPLPGRRLDVVTSTPGFEAAVYGAPNGVPGTIGGWTKLSGTEKVAENQRFQLDTAKRRFRYYLVWISTLPEGGKARIQELSLKR